MTKMLLEWLKRWRCMTCRYITFVKPSGNDCPSCSHTVSYEELAGIDEDDPIVKKRKTYKRREKHGNKRSRNKGKKIVPAKVSSATASH